MYYRSIWPSWARKILVPFKVSTFQSYSTISMTKKGVTWAGCNFPIELCVGVQLHACMWVKKKGTGREKKKLAALCINVSVCRQSTTQNFLSWGPRVRSLTSYWGTYAEVLQMNSGSAQLPTTSIMVILRTQHSLTLFSPLTNLNGLE